ncbi:hypothetical protein BJY00DRAFT_308531 [Aspergillus carlsbadensis]|nr:hypothetical protein BJY00DRAFT_308531 [Aspergillus carlsbadensis]
MTATPILLSTILSSRHLHTCRAKGLAGTVIISILSTSCMASFLGWLKNYAVDHNGPDPRSTGQTPPLLAGLPLPQRDGVRVLPNHGTMGSRRVEERSGAVCVVCGGTGVRYTAQTIVQVVLYVVSLVCMGVLVVFYVCETNYFLEGAVIIPEVVEERLVKEGAIVE